MMKHFLRRYLYIMREEEIIMCVLREGGRGEREMYLVIFAVLLLVVSEVTLMMVDSLSLL